MNTIDDATIERYLDGQMSAPEQAQFRALMATDPALRRRVVAEESLLRAMRSDRDSTPRNHAELRSRLLASIPAGGAVAGSPVTGTNRRPRWPLFGLMAIVGAWIVLDFAMTEWDASGAPTGPQRQAVTPGEAQPSTRAAAPGSTNASGATDASSVQNAARASTVSGNSNASGSSSASGAAARTPSARNAFSSARAPSATNANSAARPPSAPERKSLASPSTRKAGTASRVSGARDAEASASRPSASKRQLPIRTDSVARTKVDIGH